MLTTCPFAIILLGNSTIMKKMYKINPTDHKEIKWISPTDLKKFDFTPADTKIINKIQGEYPGN